MAAGGIAIALLVLMAIQTMWPIVKEAYIVAHTNYQVAYIPNIRYEQEYLAQVDLATVKAELKQPNSEAHGDTVDVKIEHDDTGYYLVYINSRNLSQVQARKFAKLISNGALGQNIMVRVQSNGPKVKQPKNHRETFDI